MQLHTPSGNTIVSSTRHKFRHFTDNTQLFSFSGYHINGGCLEGKGLTQPHLPAKEVATHSADCRHLCLAWPLRRRCVDVNRGRSCNNRTHRGPILQAVSFGINPKTSPDQPHQGYTRDVSGLTSDRHTCKPPSTRTLTDSTQVRSAAVGSYTDRGRHSFSRAYLDSELV